MESLLELLLTDGIETEELLPLLDYLTGTSIGGKMQGWPFAVKEGVLVATLTHGNPSELVRLEYYSDNLLFQENPGGSNGEEIYTIWPLLPIDKN